MFTCAACRKQPGKAERDADEEETGSRRTASTKEAVKSLSAQIKDMVLRLSCTYRQGIYRKDHRPHSSSDMGDSNRTPYSFNGGGSSTSMPQWNFKNPNHNRVLSIRSPSKEANSMSTRSRTVLFEDENEPKEWMTQVEPGVHITFMSLPNGGNDLKRIRFCREMFNKWEAQKWWEENYDRIMELFNVQRFNRRTLHTPPRFEDVRDSFSSKMGSVGGSPTDFQGGGQVFRGRLSGQSGKPPSLDASVSISNASDVESEWVEEDEPGVYITIRQLVDGTRELRRVRFSRERFGEVRAKQWWEENKERVQAQYL